MQTSESSAYDLPKTLELHRALAPKMEQSVTPIAMVKDGTTHQLGTGTLFRVADFSFMVTAAHVMKKARKCHAQLRLLDGTPADRTRPCRGVALSGWSAYIGKDPADAAIVPLSEETVTALTNRRFLRLDEIAPRPLIPGGCWVMGYPDETLVRDATSDKVTFAPFLLAVPLVENRWPIADFDETYNFLMNADRESLLAPDGTPGEIPDELGGISGCSVWQVLWPDGEWQPKHVRIVGVQTAYYRKYSLIKATHWGAVVAILLEYHPEFRDIINMHLR